MALIGNLVKKWLTKSLLIVFLFTDSRDVYPLCIVSYTIVLSIFYGI